MPPNLSMSTGFGLFWKSNLLTAHEHVANKYIDAYVYIHLLCLVMRNAKARETVVIVWQNIVGTVTFLDYNYDSDPGGTLKKIKALFSRNEKYCISKEVKGNHADQKQQ